MVSDTRINRTVGRRGQRKYLSRSAMETKEAKKHSNRHFIGLLDALRIVNATKLYFCGVQMAVIRGYEAGYVVWLDGLRCELCNMTEYVQLRVLAWRCWAGGRRAIKEPGQVAGVCEAEQSKTGTPPSPWVAEKRPASQPGA